ncbi:MAG: CDP-diacylglycerol--glycerol-3-phosphate 3-phosphatidyltransferase [Cyanobacteria bacterium REEB65]|nr:CDP-diacylglycerol--glycerol-3-phosphate 3-phosphatidyltransferase [Cyanobacteria bacterium REEB65]
MNLPTWLTSLRIALALPLAIAFEAAPVGTSHSAEEWSTLAFGCFLLAAATDWLDGFLARRWHQTSSLGALLDPLADKILVTAALVGLAYRQVIPAWSATLILAREFLVTGLRVAIAESGQGIRAAAWSGKLKAALQMVAITLYLWPGATLKWPADVVYGLALIATVTSGAEYVWKARALWRSP